MIQIISQESEIRAFIHEAIQEAVSNLKLEGKEPAEIIDSKELMRRLNISHPTLIRWKDKGKIPSIKFGGTVRFNYPEVLKSLEAKGA